MFEPKTRWLLTESPFIIQDLSAPILRPLRDLMSRLAYSEIKSSPVKVAAQITIPDHWLALPSLKITNPELWKNLLSGFPELIKGEAFSDEEKDYIVGLIKNQEKTLDLEKDAVLLGNLSFSIAFNGIGIFGRVRQEGKEKNELICAFKFRPPYDENYPAEKELFNKTRLWRPKLEELVLQFMTDMARFCYDVEYGNRISQLVRETRESSFWKAKMKKVGGALGNLPTNKREAAFAGLETLSEALDLPLV